MTSTPGEVRGIPLPWGAWYGEGVHSLELPGSWEVVWLAPYGAPALDSDEIRHALSAPVDSRSPTELAQGASHAVIAVDDLARPTPADEVLNPLLDLLADGGLPSSSVRVVVAVGAHSPPDPRQLAAKLGRRVLAECPVEIHDPHGDLADTGVPYGDQTLRVNRAFFEAPLKIGISSVLPHPFAGYGGGAKMMLPGLTDLRSTERSHKFVLMGLRGGTDPDQNRFRTEIEEIARRVGFQFTICCVPNASREIAAIYSGDIVAAHRAASRHAARVYASPVGHEFDCLVINAYPKDLDLLQSQGALVSLKTLNRSPVRAGGIVLLTTAASQGGGHHELFGPGGRAHGVPRPMREFSDRDLWIYAPSLSPETVGLLFHSRVRCFQTPESLLTALRERLGVAARCAIVPCGPLQQLRSVS